MPPSPALSCSSGREIPGKKHRRGHSIEYGILSRDKDDDLALFSEMQVKETDGFLLHSSDDLDDAFSTKLKHFSEFTIPLQGESSRLLSSEGDKNDYDWLLTPPDTPLFRSLDEEPPLASAGRRGRPQSQILLSRSSTMDKKRRSSKGSASPNRLSTSPRADIMQQNRGRPSSARHLSPVSGQRSTTPVKRISPSPGKPSGPVPRSSTPTSRRMSTGSTSPAVRGTSPVRSSRGNSASPKIKVWEANIPGFSLDAPPNLLTSLGDRPSSYVRGSSPASRNGRDSASTRSRQSVSPSASRSVSSSHSHERDRFSSHSKGSVASSGDDDLHSIQSIPVCSSERVISKRASLSPNTGRTSRSLKLMSPASAPRRPFESALRPMDHPKSHHSMFRPLASSLPSTDIYSGKGSSSYQHIMLRHSSATVGSNSSSVQVTKGSDPIPVFQSKVENLDYQDKLALGMVDSLNEDSRHESHESSFSDQLGAMDQCYSVECESSMIEEVNHHVTDVENSSTNGSLHVGNDILEVVALETMEVCGRCGSEYHATEETRSGINMCPDCREENNFVKDSPKQSHEICDEKKIVEKIPAIDVLESLPVVMEAVGVGTRENKLCDNSYDQEPNHLHENSQIQSSTGCDVLRRGSNVTETRVSDKKNDMKFGSPEGRGIPLVITRSVSMKSHNVQANNSSGLARSCDGFSYIRDKSNSLRSSTETTSATSSCDYGFSLRKGSHQSGSTLDISKSLSSMSVSTGVSSHTCQAVNVMSADSFEVSSAEMRCTHDETHQDSECKKTSVMNAHSGESDESIGLSTNVVGTLAEDNSVISDSGIGKRGDDVANTVMSKEEISESPAHIYDHSRLQEKDGNETSHHCSSTMPASEMEPESCKPEIHGLGSHDEILTTIAKADCSLDHHDSMAPVSEILDESTILVECAAGKEPKSLTLEEATDTILFCSSIVHDLVYKASTIAKDVPDEAEMLRPTVGKSNASKNSYARRGGKKQSSKIGKVSRMQTERDDRTEVHIENDEAGMIIRNVSKEENLKPPKVENKCNCSIM